MNLMNFTTKSVCVFCKIINKELKADIVFEDADILAFKDIHPTSPVHILIVTKKHFESVNDWNDGDIQLAGRMIIAAKKIAEKFGIKDSGYKLLIRTGRDGGQEIGHIHLHLQGGARLG